MDLLTPAQTPLGMKPAPASAALRPGLTKAAIGSSLFDPYQKKLPTLTKLHILANHSSFNSIISWTDGGNSFAIKRVEYQRRIMNVFFEQNKFKSFQNMLSRYRFKTVRTINGGTAQEIIIYSHPLFTRGHLDIDAIMKLTKGVATAQSSKIIAKRSETRLNDKTPLISSHGAAEGQLQVLSPEIDDLAAIEPVPTNTVFENKFDSDATLADSKQWLLLFHEVDIDVTDPLFEVNIDDGMM